MEAAYKPTVGNPDLRAISNDSDTRLQVAASKNLVIKSIMFEHKKIHVDTWISHDGRTRNQIDNIVVDDKHPGNILDVRSVMVADADT